MFSNRHTRSGHLAAKNAKFSFMTPGILGDFVNILGELGFLAVQVRNSYY